jgi:AcrR family transcriptional regulator
VDDRVKRRRRYDSPLRREQAAATRERILRAAQELFERDGYTSTSMAKIASNAGVSLKTLYLVFQTKSGLLRGVWHRVLRGEHDTVSVGGQRWYREVLDEPDPVRQLRLNMRNSIMVKTRAAALLEVIRSAAATDPEIRELWERIEAEFHENQRTIVESLADKRALAGDLDVSEAADILWALNHPALYALLVGERGWSSERYEKWLGDVLCNQLLGPETPAAGPMPSFS